MLWRVALLAALIALAGVAWSAGWVERLEPERVGDLLRESGAWGPALFILAFAVGNGLGAPGALFLLPAIAVWPPEVAFPLVWLGCIAAGTVGYAFARTLGRRFVEHRLPERLRHLDARAAEHAVRTVAVVRLTLYLLTPAHWALGLSSIRLTPFLIGSALGFLPASALWTFAGAALFDVVREAGAGGWLLLLAFVALAVAVPRWLTRRRDARLSGD